MTTTNKNFRTDLQGLRAIAILLIVIAHSSLGIFQGGFVGVDVFFVLSGFLITGLLQKELVKTDKILLMNFYSRRFKRLLPALLFMVLVVFFLAYLLLSKHEYFKQLGSTNYALTWISNFYFTFREIDYFDELSTQDLFLHTWSLGVEEQFYLIWPFIIGLIYRLDKKLKSKHYFSLIIIFVVSFILSIIWTAYDSVSAFYLMPSRIWQFSLGALVYFHIKSPSNYLSKLSHFQACTIQFTGIILVVGSGYLFKTSLSYPGFWALLPSIGSVLIILAGVYINEKKNLLSHPIFLWLGDHSYSFYLWHWPILILGFSLGFKGQIFPTIFLLVLALAMARISLLFIEKPFWKGKLSLAMPRKTILTSVLLMIATTVLIVTPYRKVNHPSLRIDNFDSWRSDVPAIYQQGCDDWYHSSSVNKCSFGNKLSSKTVVLMGDSILAQWFSMLPIIYKSPTWHIIVMTKSSCPMIDKDFYYERIGKVYKNCSQWRNSALDELDIIAPDLAIIGNSTSYKFSEEELELGSTTIINRVSKAAKIVYVIPGTPGLTFDGPSCLSRNSTIDRLFGSTSCYAKEEDDKVELSVKILKKITTKFSNVSFLNLNDLVCPNGICYAIDDEKVVVYRDKYHLTDTFVRNQSENIFTKINQLTSIE